MMDLFASTLIVSSALAVEPDVVDAQPLPGRFPVEVARPASGEAPPSSWFPPVRVEHRIAVRDLVLPTLVNELGVLLGRWGPYTVELAFSAHLASPLNLPDSFRRMGSIDVGLVGGYAIGNWLSIGPEVGLAYRWYDQRGFGAGAHLLPTLSARANVGLLRARHWSVALSTRAGVDLVRTRLVLDTSRIVDLPPFEVQAGLRVLFGYGRDRRVSG